MMTTPRSYKSDAAFAAFPLGGIGTGNISLGARGDLRDFELFNHPDKGCKMPFSFFAIRAEHNGVADARVLESQAPTDFYQARGYHPNSMAGMPHFKESALSVAYPFAEVSFADDSFPLRVSLRAFTPFIPLNADDSAIPAAVFRYTVRNTTDQDMNVSLAATMPNISGYNGSDVFDNYKVQPGCFNETRSADGFTGIVMDGDALPKQHIRYANNAILTREASTSAKPQWQQTGWWDGLYDFWDDFTDDGALRDGAQNVRQSHVAPAGCFVGSLAVNKKVAAGCTETFEFVLSWYVPYRVKGWGPFEDVEAEPTIRNHYATLFDSAWDAGCYLLKNLARLESVSQTFTDAVYSSTLPEPVIDAVMSNITVVRSTTCFRLEDGTFLAWEGSHEHAGSCPGTCTHVWNYAQTLAFLFPELEKTSRRNEFLRETNDDGKMAFRGNRIFDRPEFDMLAAADGQLGTIVRVYREWSLTGDDAFLQELWPKLKLAIAYTQKEWDKDGDELLEARQHNTYDIEFHGVNSLTGVMYLAALAAMVKMAQAMGEDALAAEYARKQALSAQRLDQLTYNGEFYIQPIDDVNAHPYQYGTGCLSDQLFGQTLAHVAGLGYLLPQEHVKSAAHSIFQYNFKTGEQRGPCLQRLYVAEDEPGLVLAAWPHGGKPKLPFVYADEVWTGIEYHVATLLIYEGFVDEALAIVEAVRARQNGYRRNPWNEMECGFHYARSLASWGLLVALSGARYDAASGVVSFEPKCNEDDFHCFFSNGDQWGMLHRIKNADGSVSKSVEVLGTK